MKHDDRNYKAHVFVCTRKKETAVCCAARGSEELWQNLKKWAASKPEWKNKIRINAAGCMDRCQNGIAVAIYPQNIWFTEVCPDDLEALKEHIEAVMASE